MRFNFISRVTTYCQDAGYKHYHISDITIFTGTEPHLLINVLRILKPEIS